MGVASGKEHIIDEITEWFHAHKAVADDSDEKEDTDDSKGKNSTGKNSTQTKDDDKDAKDTVKKPHKDAKKDNDTDTADEDVAEERKLLGGWTCHQYQNEQDKDWCENAGTLMGMEFKWFGGANSQCGGCHCCKKKATHATKDN